MSADPEHGFHIFLSYRREGTSAHAGRLHDFLISGVGDQPGFDESQIFMDIDTIQPGDDFREVIADAVASCDVFLAVIGGQWAAVQDGQGRRRLDNPADYVRLEIEAALERAIPVIPILVDRAEMPTEAELPESISSLVYRNGVELSDKRWRYDVGQLLYSLKKRQEAALASTSSEAPSDVQPPEAIAQSQLEVATGASPELQDTSADLVEDGLVATDAVESSLREPETPEVAPKPAEDPIALDAARRKFHGLLDARIKQLERTTPTSAPKGAKRTPTYQSRRTETEEAFVEAWAKWTRTVSDTIATNRRKDFKTMWTSLEPGERLLVVAQCTLDTQAALLALTDNRLMVVRAVSLARDLPLARISQIAKGGNVLGKAISGGKLKVSTTFGTRFTLANVWPPNAVEEIINLFKLFGYVTTTSRD